MWPQLGFPFAKLLRNFCGTKRKIFFLCASVLRKKTTICAIIRKSHFAQNCPIPLLQNLSFAQFRNFICRRCVFLRIQFWKKLVLECLPIGHFYIIDQWQLRRVQISWKRTLFTWNYLIGLKYCQVSHSNFYFINFGPLI